MVLVEFMYVGRYQLIAVEMHIENCILHSFICSVFLFVIVLVYLLGYYYYASIVSGHVTFDHLEV